MKKLLKILITIVIISLSSCDIFEVRDPESPTDTRSGYIVPVQPTDIIQNLITAFSERNANDYKKSFAEGPPIVNRAFVFIPSGNVLSSFPPNWSINEEFQYFNNLISRTPEDIPINLSLVGEQINIQSDSAFYSAGYSISVPIQNGDPQIIEGSLKFTMTTDNNNTWVIYFWEDIALPDPSKNSWSKLKIEYY